MADEREAHQHESREKKEQLRKEGDDRDGPVRRLVGGISEHVVDAATAVSESEEPAVDAVDRVGEAHESTLGEVTEFVGHHAGELAQGHCVDKREADGENKA